MREKDTLERAAQEARDSATHPESKPENKYDTRGLEASYLAHGQSQRAESLKKIIQALHEFQPTTSEQSSNHSLEKIAVGSLLKLNQAQHSRWIFIVPTHAGSSVNVDGTQVQVLSRHSPLAQQLIGKHIDDEFEFQKLSYSIEEII